jgi:flagellin
MSGKSFVSGSAKDADWSVQAGTDQLDIGYTDKAGNAQTVSITAKEGDDIEQLATYINGQTQDLQASVGEDGTLQVFAGSNNIDTAQAVSFSGTLGSDLAMGAGTDSSVASLDVTSVAGAQQAVSVIDNAMKSVDSHRAELGAFQNRFDHAINNLDNINENVNASKSRIKDTDFAKETTAMTKSQILQQASTSILAQAKAAPNQALSLL